MKKIRLGVVGLGNRGRGMYSLACDSFDFVVPAAACDIRPRNWYERKVDGKLMCEKYPDAKFYEDYDEMLDKAELDAIIVETGADIHAEFCAKALKKNVNVMTDIPVVASLAEAEMLWQAAQETEAIISVGANPNEQKFTVLLKEFYKKGLLGNPYCMEAEYIHWSLPDSEERRILYENGDWRRLLSPIRYCTHSLGPLLTVLENDELRKAQCFNTGAHHNDLTDNGKPDDMQCAQFQSESGVVIRLMRNGRCRADIGHHTYRVFGSEGYMERTERCEKSVIRYNSTRELDTSLKEIPDGIAPEYAEAAKSMGQSGMVIGHGGTDYALFDHFLKALQEGKPAPISLKEGLRMTIPGIYAEESGKRGGEILRMVYPWDPDWSTEFKKFF